MLSVGEELLLHWLDLRCHDRTLYRRLSVNALLFVGYVSAGGKCNDHDDLSASNCHRTYNVSLEVING